MSTDRYPELQREVQRLLGRCLFRLQQYERLMKALLANHELGGTIHEMEAQRDNRVQRFSGRSLGLLAKELFDALIVVEGTERQALDESALPSDQISMSYQFQIHMSEDRWAQTKAAVEELVAMRNALVHHFLDQFDVRTDEGCVTASEHLVRCYDRIDMHFLELREWAQQLDQARALHASFCQSDAFYDLFVNGIAPDGSFDWPSTGIARALRHALQAVQTGGWANLDTAKTWMAENNEEQSPEMYGCRNWPQVLHESRLFTWSYRFDAEGRKTAWYREHD